jgi:hypothetical protein
MANFQQSSDVIKSFLLTSFFVAALQLRPSRRCFSGLSLVHLQRWRALQPGSAADRLDVQQPATNSVFEIPKNPCFGELLLDVRRRCPSRNLRSIVPDCEIILPRHVFGIDALHDTIL